MNSPYRVIVWGPGSVGVACIKSVLDRPEFELVGVLAYNPEKNGKDVGELINRSPVCVKVTTDKEAIVAMDADCVIWTGTFLFPHLIEEMDNYVVKLLESGKNVVTPTAYHYPLSHGKDYLKRFEDACASGNSSLHGTGENPGFWLERMATTMTGLTDEVEHIQLDEYLDLSTSGADYLGAAGFGMSEEQCKASMAAGPLKEIWSSYYYVESMNLVSMSQYGKPLDNFEIESEVFPAGEDIQYSRDNGDSIDLAIAKDTVIAQKYFFRGYVDGIERFVITTNWFLGQKYSPFGKEDSVWDITIEGKPLSLSSSFRAMASVKNNIEILEGDETAPTWYATAIPCVQAVPIVCESEPGMVYASVFANSVPDYRTLVTRKSLID